MMQYLGEKKLQNSSALTAHLPEDGSSMSSAVSSTLAVERDRRMFGGHWVKMCVFVALLLPVAVAERQFVAVRNGDKVTLPCGRQLHSCRSINWLFAGRSFQMILLVKEGEVPQQYVEEYGPLSLTSDCSLDIMKITEELAGLFTCRWSGTYQDLETIFLSVVTLTRTDNHQLSCSVTSQGSFIHKVRWLYDGKPYSQPEPRYGSQHTVAMCQDCEEPLQEELFSCEVWSDSTDVQLFPLIHQTEGHDGTTPRPTTTGSTGSTGSTGNTGNTGWWRHLVALLLVVVVMCILVDFLLWKRAKGKKKLQEENTGELVVSYTKRGAKVRVQVTDGEDGGEVAPSGGAADESTLYCNVSTLDG
ncbi:uncharacterized protein LOC142882023 isoform X6 [Nelusetta ayraudi]|uniref:uncharacterized protein LOC142882023 isoform X6 n=1 Tax=Nelusetta ayraudi TaxID=303726 RepID=UPI003F71C134